jgi:ankyrin repeat protein
VSLTDYIDIAEFLIEYGADVNNGNDDGYTVLKLAMLNEKGKAYDMVKMLIEHGANVHMENPIIESNNLEITKLFLDHGADPNATDESGNSAFTIAIYRNNISIAKLLYNAGADIDNAINYATLYNMPHMINRIKKVVPAAAFARRGPLLAARDRIDSAHVNYAASEAAWDRLASIRRKNVNNSNGKSRRLRKGRKGRMTRRRTN